MATLFEKIELEADEVVIKTVRKHWFVITIEILCVVAVGLLPVIFVMLLPVFNPIPLLNDWFVNNLPLILFGLAAWLLGTTMAVAITWTNYFLDLWIITDRRIIVIEQVTFFNRKVSNFRLERMQDIKVTVSGIIPTLLNFGTIRAQTASAAESNFTSPALPDPRGLQAIIQNAMDARLTSIGGLAPGAE